MTTYESRGDLNPSVDYTLPQSQNIDNGAMWEGGFSRKRGTPSMFLLERTQEPAHPYAVPQLTVLFCLCSEKGPFRERIQTQAEELGKIRRALNISLLCAWLGQIRTLI